MNSELYIKALYDPNSCERRLGGQDGLKSVTKGNPKGTIQEVWYNSFRASRHLGLEGQDGLKSVTKGNPKGAIQDVWCKGEAANQFHR